MFHSKCFYYTHVFVSNVVCSVANTAADSTTIHDLTTSPQASSTPADVRREELPVSNVVTRSNKRIRMQQSHQQKWQHTAARHGTNVADVRHGERDINESVRAVVNASLNPKSG